MALLKSKALNALEAALAESAAAVRSAPTRRIASAISFPAPTAAAPPTPFTNLSVRISAPFVARSAALVAPSNAELMPRIAPLTLPSERESRSKAPATLSANSGADPSASIVIVALMRLPAGP